MVFNKKVLFFFITFFLLLLASSFKNLAEDFITKQSIKPPKNYKVLAPDKSTPKTQSGKIKYPHDFTIVLLGDSMTEAIGAGNDLKGYLNEFYPNKYIEVLNYGYGSTNIESAPDRLTKETLHNRVYAPILNIDFDLLIIESFGNNPLSKYGVDEGLKKHREVLDQMLEEIKKAGKQNNVAFLATVAPTEDYAKNSVNLTRDVRRKWITERKVYIENHIKYAKDHNIPIINAYQLSLNDKGYGKQIFIRKDDYIHPSPTGILFMDKLIADFIHNQNLIKN